LKTLIVRPDQSLVEEVVGHLECGDRDYSSNIVVFPGKRPSHFLRKAISRTTKGSFIPPVIFSIDELVDAAYEKVPALGKWELSGYSDNDHQPRRKIETIDAVAVLYNIHKKALQPLGGNSFTTPDSFFPIGLKIYRDLEELLIEEIKPAQLRHIESFVDESIPERTLKGLQSLSFFYEHFYREVEKQGLSTRSLRYRAMAEQIDGYDLADYKQVIFAGFYALTRCEKLLFKKLLGRDNTLFIFQEGPGLEEILADLGISGKDSAAHAAAEEDRSAASLPEISFYGSPDTHGQVYALSKIISEHTSPADSRLSQATHGVGEGFLTEKTAIVLPVAETLFPLLRQGLSFLDENAYNISLGYPLHRTPIFGFLNNLMELITSIDEERIYIPDYLKFVLHPYTKNIYYAGDTEITRIMFHAVEEKLTVSRTRTFTTLRELEEDRSLIGHIVEKIPKDGKNITEEDVRSHLRTVHRNTIEGFMSFENIRDFAQKCIGLLTYIFQNSNARLHPLFYPFSESFLRELDVISRSMLRDFGFRETVSYFTFFRKYITTAYSPFEGTPLKGIQILGFLETRNIRFDEVFILDANEETLPDTRRDDSILPFKARQILGLPTYTDRDRLASYYFETLLKGARKAHIFFIENDKKERSRFVEKLLWERQKRDKTTDTKKYIFPVQYKVNLRNSVPAEVEKSGDVINFLKGFSYHATALGTYLACQLQFYYAYVLGLGKREEVTGDIERMDIGKLVHAVLAEFFRKRKGRPLKEEDMNAGELLLITDKLFRMQYGEGPSGAAYLLQVQIQNRMRDVLNKYYLPLIMEERVTVLGTERKIAISEGPFRLKGYLDSIERRGERVFIVDYKTGSFPDRLKINFRKLDIDNRASWEESIGSLQLPFYLMLYSRETGAKVKDLNGIFLLLGQSVISRKIELPLFEEGNEEQIYGMLESVIMRLLGEIVDPALPFRPARDKKSSCPDCSFKYICGTQWVVK
jgi:ATP-dependent helicase/nuclease subunit B